MNSYKNVFNVSQEHLAKLKMNLIVIKGQKGYGGYGGWTSGVDMVDGQNTIFTNMLSNI